MHPRIGSFIEWIRHPWSRGTDDVASRVEHAAENVGKTNAEISRATLDHVDSGKNVEITVQALLDRLERRGVRDE